MPTLLERDATNGCCGVGVMAVVGIMYWPE
jgi:hypothetical protein